MKINLLFKYLTINIREYILIFLSSTIFLFFIHEKSFSKENLFTVNNVEVQGVLDLNFNREKYINKAFINSFKVLMKKILLTRDLNKVNNIKLKDVKNFVDSFQILEENYNQDEYKLKIKILYNENKIKKFLSQKNISFSQPDNISVIFYPVFFDGGEMKNFNENYFYEMWTEVKINNEVINFVLPLEDLEDISKIIEIKDRIEEINVGSFVNKYNIKDYVFALMDFQNDKLSIHLKINFNNIQTSKNIHYTVRNINDKEELNSIIKDLKFKIIDFWKEENLINISIPLSVKLKFYHKSPQNLDKLRNTFKKISIINNSTLEEFDINNSFFKIYYFGNPKKLRSELAKFGYLLKNEEGSWQLYLNE
tara:strand:- start:586 stop:1683 length:1098 start_codon:yes stop_codon:yes gene_type:complete